MVGGDWRARAICPPHAALFGSERAEDYKAATAICLRCPVREACLVAAMDEEDGTGLVRRAGVRGALTPTQRHALHRADQRAAARARLAEEKAGLSDVSGPPSPAVERPDLATAWRRSVRQTRHGGHLVWTGPLDKSRRPALRHGGQRHPVLTVAFRTLHGREPHGTVRTTCGVYRCMAHLADAVMRAEDPSLVGASS
ncbi:WhiB family transcriptional regulator [Streptomyces corynorhini]|uniref:4Fe-4S Wbl-type domain-containing protein n=1 Tax=Streptomyces corynorhini TaxID=2282652 RepID=A0A370AYF2_9ACTN|nr:WhiB family transcriptional regulator [Streptomyces corynorhini]RDG34667.1 hypothetical protein DVH02_29340 [Streptomyces corynorhini]